MLILTALLFSDRSTCPEVFSEISSEISENSQENTSARVSFLIKLQTQASRVSDSGKISKNTFSLRSSLVVASSVSGIFITHFEQMSFNNAILLLLSMNTISLAFVCAHFHSFNAFYVILVSLQQSLNTFSAFITISG